MKRFLGFRFIFFIKDLPARLMEAPVSRQLVLSTALCMNCLVIFSEGLEIPLPSSWTLWRDSTSSLKGMWLGVCFLMNLLALLHQTMLNT